MKSGTNYERTKWSFQTRIIIIMIIRLNINANVMTLMLGRMRTFSVSLSIDCGVNGRTNWCLRRVAFFLSFFFTCLLRVLLRLTVIPSMCLEKVYNTIRIIEPTAYHYYYCYLGVSGVHYIIAAKRVRVRGTTNFHNHKFLLLGTDEVWRS